MSVQFLQKSNFDPSKIDIMKVIDVMVGSLSHSAIFQKPKVFITPDFFHSAIFQKPKGFITPDFFHSAIFLKPVVTVVMSVNVSRCQYISVVVSSVGVSTCQYVSVSVGRCQYVSVRMSVG